MSESCVTQGVPFRGASSVRVTVTLLSLAALLGHDTHSGRCGRR